MRAAFDIFIGGLIRRDQTGAGTAFDGHVADGHAAFHRQIADRFAAIFDDIAGAASGAGLADHGQSDVLGGHARLQFAGDFDLHVLGFLLDQRLGGQNVLDLGCADAVRQRAKRAVGGGVAVAANHGHAGQGPALLGADDMHDALTDVMHRVVVNAEILGVLVQRFDLNARFGFSISHGFSIPFTRAGLGVVGYVVIRSPRWSFRARAPFTHARGLPPAMRRYIAFKGLRAGHFVHQMAVDIQQAGAI